MVKTKRDTVPQVPQCYSVKYSKVQLKGKLLLLVQEEEEKKGQSPMQKCVAWSCCGAVEMKHCLVSWLYCRGELLPRSRGCATGAAEGRGY